MAGLTEALQVALIIRAALSLRHYMVDVSSRCHSPLALAGLAEVLVTGEDAEA
jgi:hypothetical protein